MPTTEEYAILRAKAGARYSAAVAELKESYVELLALDLTLANVNVGNGEPMRSFTGEARSLPAGLRHVVFADPSPDDWSAEAMKKHQQQVARHVAPPAPEVDEVANEPSIEERALTGGAGS